LKAVEKSSLSQEIRFCVTQDGVRLAYAKSGQGPPLDRIGTWLTHLEYDWNSPLWRPWLDNFSRFHTLYRYDQRGCGLSDWDVDTISFDMLLSDLETVIDAAGLDQFALIGVSNGGSLALNYAVRHPEKVSHLLIYGGYMRGMAQRSSDASRSEEIAVHLGLVKYAWSADNPAYKFILSMELLPDATLEQISWLNDLQRLSTSADNAVRLQKAYNPVNVVALASNIDCPTLILHAKHDAAVPFEEGRLCATHIPNARLVPIDSKNHLLLSTEPAWEQFWREFYQFLGISEVHLEPISQTPGVSASDSWIAQLTLREREILHLLANGQRNDEIAQALVLTPKTVRNYISRIYEKLDVTSRGEAIVLAREAGFDKQQ
jgi:pimeloyl-ACP methyl ester carboxylesterase/DNA-binding CsgD family transcriptional regulator